MKKLKAGFAKVNINPPMGIPLRGYFKEHLAEGVLDDLEAVALALECDDIKVLLISVDNCGIELELSKKYRNLVSSATNIPSENFIISATHTHQGPEAFIVSENKLVAEYTEFLGKRIADAAVFAVSDLKEAKMGYGKG